MAIKRGDHNGPSYHENGSVKQRRNNRKSKGLSIGWQKYSDYFWALVIYIPCFVVAFVLRAAFFGPSSSDDIWGDLITGAVIWIVLLIIIFAPMGSPYESGDV